MSLASAMLQFEDNQYANDGFRGGAALARLGLRKVGWERPESQELIPPGDQTTRVDRSHSRKKMVSLVVIGVSILVLLGGWIVSLNRVLVVTPTQSQSAASEHSRCDPLQIAEQLQADQIDFEELLNEQTFGGTRVSTGALSCSGVRLEFKVQERRTRHGWVKTKVTSQ